MFPFPTKGNDGEVLTWYLGRWQPRPAPAGGGSYTLPTASAGTLGGVKVGANLSIDGSGVLSASGGGSGGTWSQDGGTPNTLAANAELTITHPAVTNEKLLVAVWRDTAQIGATNTTLDFDFADVGNYVLENSTYTEFNSGRYQLKDTLGGTSARATPLDRTTGASDILYGAQYSTGTGAAWNVFDSTDASTWFNYGSGTSSDAWVGFDFGSAKNIHKWRFIGRGAHWPCTVTCEWSDNGSSWTTIDTATSVAVNTQVDRSFTGASHRYWRLHITSSPNFQNTEVGQVEFWEQPVSYQTTTWYYARTTDTNRFSFTGISKVNSVAHTVTTPASTSIRVLVSFDGRSTWKKWNGSSWGTHAGGLGDIANGNTTAEVATGLTNYTPGGGETGLDFAWGLQTTDASATPSVDLVTINYDEATTYAPASVGKYGSTSEFGVKRVSSTQTTIKNQTGTSQKIHATVITP